MRAGSIRLKGVKFQEINGSTWLSSLALLSNETASAVSFSASADLPRSASSAAQFPPELMRRRCAAPPSPRALAIDSLNAESWTESGADSLQSSNDDIVRFSSVFLRANDCDSLAHGNNADTRPLRMAGFLLTSWASGLACDSQIFVY